MADTKKKKSTEKVEKNIKEKKVSTKNVEKEDSKKEKVVEEIKNEEEKKDVSTEVVEKEVVDAKIVDDKSLKNASFIQRLGAYLLDVLLIFLVASVIVTPFTTSDNYEKLSKESSEVIEEYQAGKIDIKTYVNRISDISYDLSRETGLSTIIMIAVYILYFVVYQFYNNGQTLGKKLMKIKIESVDKNELSMNMLVVRSLIINSILSDLIVLTITIFGSKDVYFVGTTAFQAIQYLVLFIIAMMVLSRKDKRGLHDILCHTKVVNVEV